MPDDDKNHSISLTNDQYLSLLKTVYLGNWLANANRGENEADKPLKEYEDIESLVLSHAKQFGYDKYIDDDYAQKGRYFPTGAFEEETDVQLLLDEYTEDTFWDELIERLAERDLSKHYSQEQLTIMTADERIEKLYGFIDTWAAEIEANGLTNIHLIVKKS